MVEWGLRGRPLIQDSSQRRKLGMDFGYEMVFLGVFSLRASGNRVAGYPSSFLKFLHCSMHVLGAFILCMLSSSPLEHFTSANLQPKLKLGILVSWKTAPPFQPPPPPPPPPLPTGKPSHLSVSFLRVDFFPKVYTRANELDPSRIVWGRTSHR